jgi:hypothetical protein
MPPRDFLSPKPIMSGLDPLEGHLAHVRHLVRPSGLESVLRDAHSYDAVTARALGARITPYIEQALNFFESSRSAAGRVRPVLQYYCYLNLAAACVCTYLPTTATSALKHHGASDMSWGVGKLLLTSKLLKTHHGAISAFHGILSDATLPVGPLTLKDLLVAIRMVGMELKQATGVAPLDLRLRQQIEVDRSDKHSIKGFSSITFTVTDPETEQVRSSVPFPLGRLYRAIPMLRKDYALSRRNPGERRWRSIKSWPESNLSQARDFHRQQSLKFMNIGGHEIVSGADAKYGWRFLPADSTPIMPTMSATLLLSFALASLCRYRPHLLDKVESSKVNLILEVYVNEVDSYAIPTFRNLLYGELVGIYRQEVI